MSEVTDAIRKEYKENDDRRDAGLTTPDDIVRFDDICYGSDKTWQLMDIYMPKSFAEERRLQQRSTDVFDSEAQEIESRRKIPVIVNVHGGAWVYGTKETYQFYCMGLAERGFAVVNLTYRLAPEFKFPAAVEDTNLVMHYIYKNAEHYGMDLNRLFAVGDSAGGHLLSIYTAASTNPAYAKSLGIDFPKDFKLRAVGLNFGKYSFEHDNKIYSDGDKVLLKEILAGQGTKEEMEKINVLPHINSDFPETCIVTAQDDFLKDQSLLLVERLVEVRVPFTFKLYGNAENALYHVFHCDSRSEAAKKCNDEQCDFFKSFK